MPSSPNPPKETKGRPPARLGCQGGRGGVTLFKTLERNRIFSLKPAQRGHR